MGLVLPVTALASGVWLLFLAAALGLGHGGVWYLLPAATAPDLGRGVTPLGRSPNLGRRVTPLAVPAPSQAGTLGHRP